MNATPIRKYKLVAPAACVAERTIEHALSLQKIRVYNHGIKIVIFIKMFTAFRCATTDFKNVVSRRSFLGPQKRKRALATHSSTDLSRVEPVHQIFSVEN
jgi:hypothetical protein